MKYSPADDGCDEATGLTDGEFAVMACLGSAWNEFLKLERQHPNEQAEFLASIHQLQGIMATRVLRRVFPAGWPTHEPKPEEII